MILAAEEREERWVGASWAVLSPDGGADRLEFDYIRVEWRLSVKPDSHYAIRLEQLGLLT